MGQVLPRLPPLSTRMQRSAPGEFLLRMTDCARMYLTFGKPHPHRFSHITTGLFVIVVYVRVMMTMRCTSQEITGNNTITAEYSQSFDPSYACNMRQCRSDLMHTFTRACQKSGQLLGVLISRHCYIQTFEKLRKTHSCDSNFLTSFWVKSGIAIPLWPLGVCTCAVLFRKMNLPVLDVGFQGPTDQPCSGSRQLPVIPGKEAFGTYKADSKTACL